MTVADLIQALRASDPTAVLVLHDCQEPGAIRELQSFEIKPVTVYLSHPDRAPRLDDSRGTPLRAIILGAR